MNKTASVIEINGNRYDAVTGQLLGAAKKAARTITKPIDGLSIDGITKPVRAVKKSAVGRSIHSLQRKPERSKTLMRTVVRRPARQQSQSKIKARRFKPDYARAARAAQIRQDAKVNRFGILSFSKPKVQSKAKVGEIMPKAAHLSAESGMAVTTLPVANNVSHQKLERLLDYALASADAHKKAAETRRRRSRLLGRLPRWAKVSLAIFIVIAVGAVVLWQEMPVASMKLAASRAHIDASLPLPLSGYKIGTITAGEHAVTTTLQSISDNSKKYTVTESASSKPSNSLAADSGGNQVQKVQDQDKTYILSQAPGSNQAACTKGDNTISIAGVGLNVAEVLEAAKNACQD